MVFALQYQYAGVTGLSLVKPLQGSGIIQV